MMFEDFFKPRISIVFNGGGARGPFQFGVYLAMIKYGLNKKIIATSGASIGAFSEVFLQLKDPVKILQTWNKIDNNLVKANKSDTSIFKILKDTLITKTQGYYSRDKLINDFLSKIDFSSLVKNTYPMYISLAECVFSSKNKVEKYLPKYVKINDLDSKTILNYLLATSSIPYVFDPVTIDNKTYVDPMKADNEPFTPLLEYNVDYLFIIPLNSSHLEKVYPSSFKFNIVDFSYPPLFKMKTLNMLDFTKESQEQYISMGYQTACLIFKLMKEEGLLKRKFKKDANAKKIYSLKYYNIENIEFSFMNIEKIFMDINKSLTKKERINYGN